MWGHFLPAAPAVLKGATNSLGIQSQIFDFNLDFLDFCKSIDQDPHLYLIGSTTKPSQELVASCKILVNGWAATLIDSDCDLLAISLFSYYGKFFARLLVERLREQNYRGRIIIGGSGIKDQLGATPDFALELKKQNLVDDFIDGDAEISWPNYLIDYYQLSYPRLSGRSVDVSYSADFSNYDISRYHSYLPPGSTKINVPVTGSRGCVRKCDFCDIHQTWKFQQRSADLIAQDVRSITEVIPNVHLYFTDSLVNGSLTLFNQLLDRLIELQKTYSFTWGGQFIIRSKNQFPESQWAKLKHSGAHSLIIGIETGSERLRLAMNKNFTNQDLEFSIEMMEKYSITFIPLLFVGHPLETEDDYQQTKDFLSKYRYLSGKIIKVLQLGPPAQILLNSPLYDNRKKLGIITTKSSMIWLNTNNPQLDPVSRLKRREDLRDLALKLGYQLTFDGHSAVEELRDNINLLQKEILILDKIAQKKTI